MWWFGVTIVTVIFTCRYFKLNWNTSALSQSYCRNFSGSSISIGNSTVSRGIWDKHCEWYFKIHQNIMSRGGGAWYLGSFEMSQAGIYPKYPEETVLFLVYTTRQRNFALYVTSVIFTWKYFKFGLNTTGLSQSHFRNLSACSINFVLWGWHLTQDNNFDEGGDPGTYRIYLCISQTHV